MRSLKTPSRQIAKDRLSQMQENSYAALLGGQIEEFRKEVLCLTEKYIDGFSEEYELKILIQPKKKRA